MATNLEKLRGLLEELFQLDQADLDFGIYRIMNTKRDEVVRFLDKDLLPQVQEAFKQYKSADKSVLQGELDKAIEQARSLGVDDPESTAKAKELRQKIANSAVDVTALENEVFSHLFNFFRRYYSEGDFLSLRRYKEGVYAIPYEGEEVKLHWANADQYYVKSSETFRDYTFKIAGGKRVRVHLVAASTEQDNNKAAPGTERRFVLSESPLSEENGELFIRFEYRPFDGKEKQDDLNRQAIDAVLKTPGFELWAHELGKLAPTDKKQDRTVLEKHLAQYTARNTFDYFIHKDLGGFLRRELDFYVKNEVMHLDDIEHESVPKVEQYLSQIKVFRSIGHKIIIFLDQLEAFQKRLWLKKKFVIETNYCVTLDRLSNKLYREIAENEEQREEWVALFSINKLEGYSEPLTEAFLESNRSLILDTRFFADDFTDRLLHSIDNLAESTCGWLIEGDSFHALSLTAESFKSTIQCLYIDPPYNTGNDGFLYKDSFKRSSWASFLFDRVSLSYRLLAETGVFFSSINEIERNTLEHMLRNVFGEENRIEELIWVQDTMRNNSPTYSTNHEYIEVFAKRKSSVEGRRGMFREPKPGYDEIMAVVEEHNARFAPVIEVERAIAILMKEHRAAFVQEVQERGGDVVEAKKNDPWKGIYTYKRAEYRSSAGILVEESDAAKYDARIWVWREVDPSMPSGKQAATTKDPGHDNFRYYKPPHPISGKPCAHPKRGWAFPLKAVGARPSFEGYVADHRIVFKDDVKMPPQIKYFLHEVSDIVSTSVIRQYSDGEQELDAMFGRKEVFPNPKPVNLLRRLIVQTCDKQARVMDFLAGSGTTGQAVLRCNQADQGARQYVLCEMGKYFHAVLKPRILKSIYSTSWKDGVPVESSGQSHLLKYLHLESLEDSLNNLELKRSSPQQKTLEGDADVREQYILSYMLNLESRNSQSLLNVEAFRKPDEYKLRIERNGETQLVNVDLVETFNWLLGLTVRHIDLIRGVRVVEGRNPGGDRVLVIWRNVDKMGNDALDKWMESTKFNPRDLEFELIYVNGDNNLENLRRADQTWKVRLIEEEFNRLMFDVQDV